MACGGRDVTKPAPVGLGRLLGVVFQEHIAPFPFAVLDAFAAAPQVLTDMTGKQVTVPAAVDGSPRSGRLTR